MCYCRHLKIIAVGAVMALAPNAAGAQTTQGGAALFEAGEKALKGGNFKAAIKFYSRAMRSNALPTKDIAKALLRRGIARRELGKPAHAIADLNSALYLGKLTPLLSARAHFHRGLAYHAVDMKGRASADLAEAKRLAPGDSVISLGLKALGKGAIVAGRSAPAIPSFTTTVSPGRDRERRAARAEKAPPKRAANPPALSLDWSTSLAPEAETEAPKPKPKGTRVGRFWDGLWKSKKKRPESAAVATETAPAASANWGRTTIDRPGASGGKSYRLQLASVKTEDEALQTWQRLSARHKDLLSGREPMIEKTDMGSLGIFYRLQIGPFADKGESLRLCNSFKRSGVDCFLIAR